MLRCRSKLTVLHDRKHASAACSARGIFASLARPSFVYRRQIYAMHATGRYADTIGAMERAISGEEIDQKISHAKI